MVSWPTCFLYSTGDPYSTACEGKQTGRRGKLPMGPFLCILVGFPRLAASLQPKLDTRIYSLASICRLTVIMGNIALLYLRVEY